MYNDIQRKITSLTLMTIMLAGGMTFAAPGMVPEAFAANANLFVSAENSQFDNYMSGPQVIEVVVIDSDINDTDEAKGEPDVTVQGKDLRMVQATDGNWYGYFADRSQALIADWTVDSVGTSTKLGQGLDFGGFCDSSLVLNGDTSTIAASGIMTMSGVTGGETVTANGLRYVAVTGTAADFTEFSIDGDDDADAAALAAAINGDTRTGITVPSHDLVAAASTNNVEIDSTVPGTAGNAIDVATEGTSITNIATGFLVGGLQASGEIDHDGSTDITAGQIITIAGQAFTGSDTPTGSFEFDTTGADGTAEFADLVTVVTAAALAGTPDITVTNSDATNLDFDSDLLGTAGDALVFTSNLGGVTINGGGTLVDAVQAETATTGLALSTVDGAVKPSINGLTYTAIQGTAADNTEFDASGDDTADATAFAAAITADTRTGDTDDVTATGSGSVVTITAVTKGTIGNTIVLTSATGVTADGSTLSGGNNDGAKAQSLTFTDTDGVYIQSTAGTTDGSGGIIERGTSDGSVPSGAECGNLVNGAGSEPGMNVVRESKNPNEGSSLVSTGQIGVDSNEWPFIQLYTLNPTGNVVVEYNKGGGAQSTTLTFDSVDQFAEAELDNTKYTTEAEIHATITDLWLNIDPTDEDSWTFGTVTTGTSGDISTNYQVFDENGQQAGDAVTGGVIDISDKLGDLMCEDNCVLKVDANAQGADDPVLTLQDNDDSSIELTATDAPGESNDASAFRTEGDNLAGDVPVTITEIGPNSGVFATYDESDTSVIIITDNAARGTSASIDYNETPVTILVGFDYATIDIQPNDDEWNSGEEIPIVIVDSDANKNSRVDEDLDLNNPQVSLIPSISTGDPFTLAENNDDDDAPITGLFLDDITAGLTTSPDVTDDESEVDWNDVTQAGTDVVATINVEKFSKRANVVPAAGGDFDALLIDLGADTSDLHDSIGNTIDGASDELQGFNLLNLDLRSMGVTTVDVWLLNNTNDADIANGDASADDTQYAIPIADDVDPQSLTDLTTTGGDGLAANLFTEQRTGSSELWMLIVFDNLADVTFTTETDPIVADFFSFGFVNDGLTSSDRIANQIIRIEVEETGDNTSTFEGSLEYKMINQLNILDANTYSSLTTIADDPEFIVIEDLTDEDSPRVNYLDLGGDGVSTQVSDQQEAPSHSGIVSFDMDTYKTADTVTITVEDLDLNVDSDLVDIYTTVAASSTVADLRDVVGDDDITFEFENGDNLGALLEVEFDDNRWSTPAVDACTTTGNDATATNALEDFVDDTGLEDTGFTLVETSKDSGVFVGDFQIPGSYCPTALTATTTGDGEGTIESVTGLDIEVNYVDFRDASGEVIKVSDSAGVRANTGSVSLDRTVYPVPFGVPDDFGGAGTTTSPDGRALFPIHQTGMDFDGDAERKADGLQSGEYLDAGDLTIHVRVNDPDFDLSASGEDSIGTNSTAGYGPVQISVIRGSDSVIIGHAGGPEALTGHIDTDGDNLTEVRQFGPMDEIAPDAGIFEIDVVLRYTDGPASTSCSSETEEWTPLDGSGNTGEGNRFDTEAASADGDYCILQGDILQVEYTDPTDASGSANTVTDSATFDLRNGVLQSDKSVYIIGSDMILTLIEPDLDLDNDSAETYDLDLIEWDSDAATITMGDANGESDAFDPEPFNFRETGDSTGIFQIVVEIPEELDNDRLERGEEAVLEYTDWGPSGSDFVGDEDEDVNLTIFTSNFGATVELDQKVYSWTDKVFITIVAPDHNFDGDLVDEIGETDLDPIKVSTRGHDIDNYKLVETGTDTGIFTGEIILTGFEHDADGVEGSDTNPRTSDDGSGPTDGFLQTDDDDGLTVSFEFSEDETVVGSSLIRWNIGEVQWLEASYPASGTGVTRVIDPDMNLDPEAVDNFDIDVWSDSDAGGIDLTVTETNEATGIFEGTVFFTVADESSGHRLRVAEGDTITAEYEDNTLPDPYTTADELDITATSLIGTIVPPLERAPAANLRTVDSFGNSLDTVSVDQQVQISADLVNGQDREQTFAYLVQIQDGNGVTVSLAWITGSLTEGQSFSPALSWIPTQAGSYTATAFVWESVDNPTALSPPVTTSITVQ